MAKKPLTTGTVVTYLGGSRSEKLKKGQQLTIAGIGPNANGTWRYNVRTKTAKGETVSTWLAGRYVASLKTT